MKKIILSLIAVLMLAVPVNVFASQYEEVEIEKEISIDKKVKNPNTDDWVDNLLSSDYQFVPTQEVQFKITVRNAGNRALDDVKYKDILPDYVSHVAGDLEDTFDLDIDQEKVFELKAQVKGEDDLPNDQNLICVVNKAEAWIDEDTDSDTAQICIRQEGEILGATLPKAGPEDNLILLLGSGIFALAGWALFKKN
jgi:uncharacterized repeat protein (TIGR01451 family)